MILELLVTLLFGVSQVLIDLIPEITISTGFISAMSDVSLLMDSVSYLLPIKTFLLCLTVFFTLHNATLIISIFNWVIRKIPGVN